MRDRALAFSKKHRLLYWIIVAVIFIARVTLSLGVGVAEKRGLTKEQLTRYTAPLFAAVMYLSILTNFRLVNRSPSNRER